jgi:hypothetical protein
MKSWIVLFTGLLLVLPATGQAATARCPGYSVILRGTNPRAAGGTSYTEIVHLRKVTGGSGYTGKWKITKFTQIVVYPWPMRMTLTTRSRVHVGYGMYFNCVSVVGGNRVVNNCTSATAYLDVRRNRVGFIKTNIWIGRIRGNQMSLKFHQPNPYEPVIRGTIVRGAGSTVRLTVTSPRQNQRFCYDQSFFGVLTLKLSARANPSRYDSQIKWTIPDIPGARKAVVPKNATGPQVTVHYVGMPKNNSDFGPKTITASVEADGCPATETRTVRFFFPLLAKNNPGRRYPNWFYYWKQTPAARPYGQHVRIEYGGTNFNMCRYASVPAQYTPGHAYKTVHVCDMSRLGTTFPLRFPLIHRSWTPMLKGYRTTHFIDTFGVAVIHEFFHWRAYHNWKKGRTFTDADNDGVPDHLEPGLRLRADRQQTYLPVTLSRIQYDEEWLAYETMRNYPPGKYRKYDWAYPGSQWPAGQSGFRRDPEAGRLAWLAPVIKDRSILFADNRISLANIVRATSETRPR